jgi:putative transport protein
MILAVQFSSHRTAEAVLMLAVIALTGLALGSIKIRGIGLGTAGVLFTGILSGHFGWHIEPAILEFVREFGLILFVFTIGLQLGPGFFAALRQDGLRLNAMAGAIVLLGVATTVLSGWLLKIDFAAMLGLFSGATTNTPSLGAAQQALGTMAQLSADRAALPSLAYALAYPGGIAGIIGSLLVLRSVFRIDPEREAAAHRIDQQRGLQPLERLNLVVENPNLDGLPIGEVPGRRETAVTISRIRRAGKSEVRTANDETILHLGDLILAVGTRWNLTQFQKVIGRASDVDLRQVPGAVTDRRVVVTRKEILGKSLEELGLDHLYGVTVTRVTRADLEISAVPELRIKFGDMLQLVGDLESLDKASAAVGNSLKALGETQFIPMFVGIALGVLAGLVPINVPGLPVPVRLGLAGGPLVLAILLGRVGRIGPLVWHMPVNANLAFRELGIVLFLACVGLKAGERFFATVFTGSGLTWLLTGLCITMLPILVVGVVARLFFKWNFTTISGLVVGSMTDPPALAFAGNISKSDAPAVAYAAVYPLTMLLRILAAQAMALMLCR